MKTTKLKQLLLSVVFTISSIITTNAGVIDRGWCTIETPDNIKSGEYFTVTVVIKSDAVKPGMKLNCDFHWMKKDGWGGTLGYIPPQEIKKDVTKYTFRTKLNLKEEMDHVYPYIFYSNDGNFNNKLGYATGEKIMPILEKKAAPVSNGETTKVDYGWCTIEAKNSVEPGGESVVTITLTGNDIKPGTKLSCDLHWMKKDGWGGNLASNGSQTITAGQRIYVFKNKIKVQDAMDHFYPFVFLSNNGNFNNRTREAHGPKSYIDLSNPETAGQVKPNTVTFKKSWMKVTFSKPVVNVDEEYECIVTYYIDPSDNWGNGTSIRVSPYGPWIDNPDGVYNKKRQHVPYPGLWTQTKKAEVGKVAELRFPQKITKAYNFNALLYVCTFVGSDGKNWPWDTRVGGPGVIQSYDIFSIQSNEIGGATWGGGTPQIAVKQGDTNPATSLSLSLKATNVEGEVVWTGKKKISFTNTDEVMITLDGLTTPGVFLIEANDGKNVRETTIANLPNVRAAIGSGRSKFGVTDVSSKELSELAYNLGFSYCRHFIGWKGLEAIRGEYTLDNLDRTVKTNNDAGIQPWIMLIGPPNWVLTNPNHYGVGYEPFPFDHEAWRQTAAHLAKHYRGQIYGFEWLNEIVPGNKCDDPVRDYIDFCRIGTEEVRKHAPEMKTMSAGGLWPRNFLLDLLGAGLCNHIDILPIHYGTRNSIISAQNDLAARGIENVSVIDNETAAGLTVFNMPQLIAMTNSLNQCRHVMSNWPAELAAGCELIIYFGGRGDACGNWSYLLDNHTPRPVIASVATVIEKLGPARPIGTYADGGNGFIHVFENNGMGVITLQPATQNDTEIVVDCPGINPKTLKATDYQGRSVLPIKTTSNTATYKLTNGMAIIVEGVPLPIHAARTCLEIDAQDAATPQISAMVIIGQEAETSIKVKNPYTTSYSGTIEIAAVDSTKPLATKKFSLQAGETARITLPLPQNSDAAVVVLKTLGKAKASTKTKISIVSIDPSQLGNMVKNSHMNGTVGKSPDHWHGNGKVEVAPGFCLGTAMKLQGDNWQHAVQNIDIPVPGKKYLYTAWVKNMEYDAGSNLSINFNDGTPSKTYFMPHVFSAGRVTDGWRFMSKVTDTPPNTKNIGPTPVGRGKGKVYFDNIRVTQYNGTEYTSEALMLPAGKSIKIDGNLSDWELDKLEPIPLLCDNQIISEKGYNWSEDSLAGVGYLRWDDTALYFAVQVQDDKHVADQTGDDALKCDAIELALHPLDRLEGEDMRAFEWFISAASPGGGSGKHTIYRNSKHNGGLSSGQLAKDSSLYDIVVSRKGNTTIYEVKIPWAETGIPRHALGVSFGMSIGLYDCDRPNGPTGKMIWGGGIHPIWIPGAFGQITLTE